MQGIKHYQEKFFVNFHLSERIPEGNIYRRLKESLDLEYLRSQTKCYYGSEGQKSIDPVVFFKLMLVGYLENISSDRKIIEQSSLRMDVLYFLGYDIDEPLPWHSTLSRTRKLFGEEVFLSFFRDILRKRVEKGMVCGKVQAVDSAFIKAHASTDSLVERELQEKSKKYFDEISENEEIIQSQEKSSNAKSGSNACKSEGKRNGRYVSKTDPDARLSCKPGKPYALNHLGIVSVDTGSHVICGAAVDHADKRDADTIDNIIGQTIENLSENDIKIEKVLADAAYSSGQAYKYLESLGIAAHIPAGGGYKPQRDGFAYSKEEDCYICCQGAKLAFKRITTPKGKKTSNKTCYSSVSDCRNCPLREKCCKDKKYKRLGHSIGKPYYDAAHEMANTYKGKPMRCLRSSTVEPVLGTLLGFLRMKKVYTKGKELAHKQLLMAAAAYNLKKLMNATGFRGVKAAVNAVKAAFLEKIRVWSKFNLSNNKILAMQ